MDTIIITNTCPFCGKTTSIEVNEDAYHLWQIGCLAQDAFPELSSSEREVLISGMCFQCQDTVFGADNEDLEDEDTVGDVFDLLGSDGDIWEEEMCDDYDDCDYEEGFDPYCGCFTYDC